MNKLKAGFLEALEQLWFHKLRTFLTLLGMIFGVGAVIAMVSVGEGAEKEALSLIDSMGLRNILVEEKSGLRRAPSRCASPLGGAFAAGCGGQHGNTAIRQALQRRESH